MSFHVITNPVASLPSRHQAKIEAKRARLPSQQARDLFSTLLAKKLDRTIVDDGEEMREVMSSVYVEMLRSGTLTMTELCHLVRDTGYW